MADGKLIRVAVGRPVRGSFTYRVPAGLEDAAQPGRRLVVPFGRGRAVGFCLGEAAETPPGALRDVQAALDAEPLFGPDLLELMEWVSDYYRYPLGEALRAALPPGLNGVEEPAASKPGVRELVALTQAGREASAPGGEKMKAVLGYLAAAGAEVDLQELGTAVPGVRDALKRLLARGLCALREVPIEPDRPELELAGTTAPELTAEQSLALRPVEEALSAGAFAPFLLHGVTGAGKTEVYLRAIARALELGKGALVLVPEIGLTPQLVGRFRARFGEKVAVLHSGLRNTERLAEWRRLKRGEAPLAVGVRSAIFAPVPNLGIVVVDEEHDGSFKQEEMLRYHARDVAVMRARKAGCPIVLGSATPSLESLHNARTGRYALIELQHRIDSRPMPEVTVLDMRQQSGHGHVSAAFPQLAAKAKLREAEAQRAAEAAGDAAGGGEAPGEPRGPGRAPAPAGRPGAGPVPYALGEAEEPSGPPLLSPELEAGLEQALGAGRQAILFLNRRGTSTYHLCLVCGKSLACPNCAVSLTLHGTRGQLMCHYCGHTRALPNVCPDCGGPIESLGMGTERVEQEVARRFPGARICRLDRDSAGQAEEVTSVLTAFARREKDILIGTQMVAKGHDFPGVTLVGVLLADLALNLPDFRASERTFQLLAQVAGRAGRGKEPGRVIVQSFNPEAPAIGFVVGHDFSSFAQGELALRKAYYYPPYCRLMAVRIEGIFPAATAEAATVVARAVAAAAERAGKELRLLGPAPAPIARLRGKSRWQLLVKGPTARSLIPAAEAVERVADGLPGNARAVVDVDPVSML